MELESFVLISGIFGFSVFAAEHIRKRGIHGKFYSSCFLMWDFSQTWFINISLNLAKYFVTSVKFSVIFLISDVSGNSWELTWPGLYDRKAFYTVKIVFIHTLWSIANLRIIRSVLILSLLLCLYCIVLCPGCARNESFNQLHGARLTKKLERTANVGSFFLNLVEIDFL